MRFLREDEPTTPVEPETPAPTEPAEPAEQWYSKNLVSSKMS